MADLAELFCKLYMGLKLLGGAFSLIVVIGGRFIVGLEEEDVVPVAQQFLLHAEMAGP